MLQNPIHLRLERLESWQHVTFMACLCERMYPNYAMFCQQTGFGDGQIYRRILDLIWETLTVKDAKVNFDSQLEKFEEAIPSADDFDLYGVYPAIDAGQKIIITFDKIAPDALLTFTQFAPVPKSEFEGIDPLQVQQAPFFHVIAAFSLLEFAI